MDDSIFIYFAILWVAMILLTSLIIFDGKQINKEILKKKSSEDVEENLIDKPPQRYVDFN